MRLRVLANAPKNVFAERMRRSKQMANAPIEQGECADI
jgi:hypothetical protein